MKTVIFPKEFGYEAKLPFDENTKALIKEARKWGKSLGKNGFTLRLRGSGPRAELSRLHTRNGTSRYYDQSIPLDLSTYVRIYLEAK